MASDNISIEDLRRLGFASGPSQKSGMEENIPSSFGNPVTNSFFGLNHMQTPLPVPMNKDHYGMVFFTRPMLNLQSANLKNVRRYYPLLTNETMSVHRAVRCMLDPRLQLYGNEVNVSGDSMGLECPLIDPLNAFMPLLSNHIDSFSGVPDVVVPLYNSPEGQYREVHTMVDGTVINYSSYNITATFRNSRGDPITKIFDYWTHYMGHVFEGLLVPYTDMMIANLIDYQTRIYRLILDPSRKTVVGIWAPGVAIPIMVPGGTRFDFNSEKPYNDTNGKIQMQFQCNGSIVDDEILVWSFNRVVGAFNPSMRTETTREQNMVKIDREEMALFNCRAYPRIDPQTRELEWWVTQEYYNAIVQDGARAQEVLESWALGAPLEA